MLCAKGTSSLVSCQGARKVVQADQADRHVAEHDGNTFHIFVRNQALVGALVVSDGFLKPILAVVDIADIDFQSREAPLVIEAREYFSGTLSGPKRLIVFA